MSPVQGLEHAFLNAALEGNLPRMKDLLDQGCPVDAQDGVSTTVVSFRLCTYIIRRTYMHASTGLNVVHTVRACTW